jgi:hypothetical protein
MANFVYDKAREKFLNGDISWTRDTFKVILLNSSYVASKDHQTLIDVPTGSRIALSTALVNKTVTNGVASADPKIVADVPSGRVIKSLIIVKQNTLATDAQSELIAYIDTASGISGTNNSGLTTTGANVTINWSGSAGAVPNKIFNL